MVERIPTYVINLDSRSDRRGHVLREFENRSEFDVEILRAKQHQYGCVGLWENIIQIIEIASTRNYDYVLICEDDHKFTENYDRLSFSETIQFLSANKAEILLGGVSWLSSTFSASPSLHWLESFNGTQFMLVFKRSYERFLTAKFGKHDSADFKISELFLKKYLMYPFISVQKGFGYSDITPSNADQQSLEQLFIDAESTLKYIIEGENFYKKMISTSSIQNFEIYSDVSIPTFIVSEMSISHRQMFDFNYTQNPEFNLRVVEPNARQCNVNEQHALLREIINISIGEGSEVIIYCNSLSAISYDYVRHSLIKYILEAYKMRIDIIYGSDDGIFNHAVPISHNFFWVDEYTSLKFVIIFENLYQRILGESLLDHETLESFISRLTSNKLLIRPTVVVGDINGKTSQRLKLIERCFLNSELNRVS